MAMEKRCPVCLRVFLSSRRDKVCCSDKCKKRRLRVKPVADRLKESFTEMMSAIRTIEMYVDDPTQTKRAQNMFKSAIREMAGYLDDQTLWDLGNEIRGVANQSKINHH